MAKMFETFNKELSWNTKFNVLLAIGMILFGYLLNDYESGLFLGTLISLIVVLFVDYYLILSKRYNKTWKTIKIIIIIILVTTVLIGCAIK